MFRALVILLLLPSISIACESYVIGFRGKNGEFDVTAFNEYVGARCSKLYNAEQTIEALHFIKSINRSYELYGFSLGAESVATIVKQVIVKPTFVLTIGAYHTTNVNFNQYSIKYKNYFDYSGTRQKSPGIHVPNVKHMDMQRYVNKELRNETHN
jgi:hypothetical protein